MTPRPWQGQSRLLC